MLSPQSTEVIRATLPVVGAAIGDITTLFYRRMFDAHPELERDLFNRGNQKQGEQQKLSPVPSRHSRRFSSSRTAPRSISYSHVSPTSMRRWESRPTSTQSCTNTSLQRSSKYSAMQSLPTSQQPGTRSTG